MNHGLTNFFSWSAKLFGAVLWFFVLRPDTSRYVSSVLADPEHPDELFVTTCPLSHVRCARCQDFDTSSYCSCFNRCDNASILLKYIKVSFPISPFHLFLKAFRPANSELPSITANLISNPSRYYFCAVSSKN